jgi:hypothetical protein
MTVNFIDPSAATNGSGTYGSPFNTIPADFSAPDGAHSYLLKAGTTLIRTLTENVNGAGSADNQRFIFGAYGEGPKPKWVGASSGNGRCLSLSNDNANITIRDIDFYSAGDRCIGGGSGTLNTTAINIHIVNCNFSMSSTNTGVDRNAVQLWGAGIKIIGCHFDGIPSDAMWISGNNAEISYNRVRNVATDGRATGDCVQFGGTSDNAWVHHNYLDHRSTQGKQCIVINAGLNPIFEDNWCYHYENPSTLSHTIYSDVDVTVRRNFIAGGSNGIWAGSSGLTLIESNLILNNMPINPLDTTVGMGVHLPAAASATVQNNTILSPLGTGWRGIKYNNGAVGTLLTVRNNILSGFQEALYINEADAAKYSSDFNVYWNNASNSNRAIGARSIIIDPRLDESYITQEAILHKYGTVGAANDLFGVAFASSIGATQASKSVYFSEKVPLFTSSSNN